MAHRTSASDKRNHARQLRYLGDGIVMLPTLKEENKKTKKHSK